MNIICGRQCFLKQPLKYWKLGLTKSSHCGWFLSSFYSLGHSVLVSTKQMSVHTESGGITLFLQLMTRRHFFFNVFSDQKSSSLHSALSSTDALINCSVFCLCSAGLENTVYFFVFTIVGKGCLIWAAGSSWYFVPLFAFYVTHISWTNGQIAD